MTTRTALAAATLAAAALTTGCLPTTGGTQTAAGSGGSGLAALADLPIAPEDTGAHYDRDDWPHWDTVTGPCDRREVTLREQGRDVRTDPKTCRVLSGTWVSPYDGTTTQDARSVDIDHMVPLAEVMRSGRIENGRRTGPRDWSRTQREHYANDPAVLVAVTLQANRAKGDQDPAHWLPTRDRCGYAHRWIAIKTTYRLAVDPAEHDALTTVLAHCPQGGDR